MLILVVLFLVAYFWGCWVFTARSNSADDAASPEHAESGAVASESLSNRGGWSSLDDRQLTRLLEESAP